MSFLQIIFDDHIELHDAHIVDLRYEDDASEVPLAHARDRYAVGVDTYQAVLNDNYFVEKLALCEKNFALDAE